MQVRNKRVISVFILAMFNVSLMASLRNLPLVAELGYQMFFFFAVVAICFLIPSALVSAELATGWTQSGGVYIWVREAFGDRLGFLAIWMQWVHNVTWYPAILAFVAATLSYLIDPSLAGNKIYIQAVVLIIFWGMTLINYFGIQTSSLISTIGVIIGTIIPGLFIIGLGITWVALGNPVQIPFQVDKLIPDFTQPSNLVFVAGLFLSFAGLEVSAGYAGEVKNPKKNFPRAIIIAAAITFFLFILGSLSIGIVVPKEKISLVSGLMEALRIYLANHRLDWALPWVAGLLIFGALAEINSWIMGPVKALHITSSHGNLPPIFQKLNRHGMPTNLLLFQAIVVTIVSFIILYMPTASASYWILTVISAQIYLVMYLLMFCSAIRLRYTHPNIPRIYRIPHRYKGIWLVASVGALASLFAICIGYVPPAEFSVGNIYVYEAFLILSLLTMIAIPLIFYHFRKPSWVPKKQRQ
ncbi:MAG: Glutamate/gamma-aminobutyrate antiporter [Chlamydiae bacterium]|nr:Glutamate/gamma-aminobutyrate antiporter [Chlamydiota bacterium]